MRKKTLTNIKIQKMLLINATVHAIDITKANNEIKVYAPCGLSDIFSKTIRPIKHKGNSKG